MIMSSTLKTDGVADSAPPKFWERVSRELFHRVFELDAQINAFRQLRSHNEGFPTEIVFCVYICGSSALYLWRYPQICPQLAHDAESVFIRALEALKLLRYDWPMAQRWEDALRAGVTSISPTSSHPPGNIHVEEGSSQDHTPNQQKAAPATTDGPIGDSAFQQSSGLETSVISSTEGAQARMEQTGVTSAMEDLFAMFPSNAYLPFDLPTPDFLSFGNTPSGTCGYNLA